MLCPGLRVGWLIPPRAYRDRAVELKQGADLQAGGLAQAIVEDYLTGGHGWSRGQGVDFDARLLRLRAFYRRRAEVLARALRRHAPRWTFDFPEGGFALWVSTDARVNEARLLAAAVGEGVSFDVGSPFQVERGAATSTAIRLCFSSAPRDGLEEGVRRLVRAFGRVARVTRGQN